VCLAPPSQTIEQENFQHENSQDNIAEKPTLELLLNRTVDVNPLLDLL
jgi:hypothetical protein